MVRLKFQLTAQVQPASVEAREAFSIIGPLLLRSPEGVVIARHVGQHWQLDGHEATRVACAQRVSLRFTDSTDAASSLTGPFDQLSFEGSYCYADQVLIAELMITTERWRHCETGLRWRGMVITPLDGARCATTDA